MEKEDLFTDFVWWLEKKKVMPEQHEMYIGNESYKSWIENFAPNKIIIVESLIPCFSTFTFLMNPTHSYVCSIRLSNLLTCWNNFEYMKWTFEDPSIHAFGAVARRTRVHSQKPISKFWVHLITCLKIWGLPPKPNSLFWSSPFKQKSSSTAGSKFHRFMFWMKSTNLDFCIIWYW